jgi:hypothetical protein
VQGSAEGDASTDPLGKVQGKVDSRSSQRQKADVLPHKAVSGDRTHKGRMPAAKRLAKLKEKRSGKGKPALNRQGGGKKQKSRGSKGRASKRR